MEEADFGQNTGRLVVPDVYSIKPLKLLRIISSFTGRLKSPSVCFRSNHVLIVRRFSPCLNNPSVFFSSLADERRMDAWLFSRMYLNSLVGKLDARGTAIALLPSTERSVTIFHF